MFWLKERLYSVAFKTNTNLKNLLCGISVTKWPREVGTIMYLNINSRVYMRVPSIFKLIQISSNEVHLGSNGLVFCPFCIQMDSFSTKHWIGLYFESQSVLLLHWWLLDVQQLFLMMNNKWDLFLNINTRL